jgi:hypothetical protein
VAVGLLTLVRLAGDTRYALGPHAPRDLGDARAALAAGLTDDSYVAVRGIPDRRNALFFEPKGDSYRRAFFRLLGTDTRLLVRADETSSRHTLDDRFVGRLRRFDDLSFGDQVREYYQKEVHATRFLDLDLLRRHLADPSTKLADRAGEAISLDKNQEVWIEVDFPADLKIALSKKQFAVEEDARHEAERLGVPVGPVAESKDDFIYVVRLDLAKRDALLKQLDQRGFPFAARRERFAAHAGELGLDGDAVTFAASQKNPVEYAVEGSALKPQASGERTRIPWARVASVQLAAPIAIPHDAWLLVENEAPADFTWVVALDAALVAFIAFNLWLLSRWLRERRPAAAA